MESNGNSDFLNRMQFRQGQCLSASDLHSIDEFNRRFRWLHNKTLHQPGIGSGFAAHGEIEDRVVTIEPGYAIDSEGREIILTKQKNLPVPSVAGGKINEPAVYDLTVSYPNCDLEEVETRQGVCQGSGPVRLREEPEFCWVELLSPTNRKPENERIRTEILTGLRVTVIRVEVQNCKLSKRVCISQRQNARPARGPKIVSGNYVPDATKNEWKVLFVNAKDEKLNINIDKAEAILAWGLSLNVDTSIGNFEIVPNYKAEIIGRRYVDKTIDHIVDKPYLLDGFVDINIPELEGRQIKNGFELRILMPPMPVEDFKNPLIHLNPCEFFSEYTDEVRQEILKKLNWRIKWVGIEG